MVTKFDKEKPAKTPRERLHAVEDKLREMPHQYDVEFIDDAQVGGPAVYLNYDFNTAVCIALGDEGMFVIDATHWDASHGIDDEHFIGLIADVDVAAQVAVQFAKDHESL